MSFFRDVLSPHWLTVQATLFPYLAEVLGPLTEKQQALVSTLEIVRLEEHLPSTSHHLPGRPLKDRAAIGRAFVAKAVYNMTTTRALLDRLDTDTSLRRICGWERLDEVPSEAVFSRAFAEFASSQLPARIHEALIRRTQGDRLVGHLSRDSTAIEAREKPVTKPKDTQKPTEKRPRGRPKKGEERPPKELTRLERQADMTSAEMLKDLPTPCDVGTKRNSQGHQDSWIGYKLHWDVADGTIPISCVLTSASTHDSQVAIPLATLSAERTTNLYDLMDSAYDAPAIRAFSEKLGHVALIDVNPRRDAALKEELAAEELRRTTLRFEMPEDVRFNERTTVERANARLKDEFGGQQVRVRGHAKVYCHLLFGVLALTADQLLRLLS